MTYKIKEKIIENSLFILTLYILNEKYRKV